MLFSRARVRMRELAPNPSRAVARRPLWQSRGMDADNRSQVNPEAFSNWPRL
jgi:hypothetical protein